MKTVAVSRNTWHYKLARHWCSSFDEMPQEFCTYVRYVVFGLMHVIVLIACLALLSVCALSVPVLVIYHVGNYFVTGDSVTQALGVSVALALFLVVVLCKIISKRWEAEAAGLRPVAEKVESVYAAAWKQWRSKVCWRVSYDR